MPDIKGTKGGDVKSPSECQSICAKAETVRTGVILLLSRTAIFCLLTLVIAMTVQAFGELALTRLNTDLLCRYQENNSIKYLITGSLAAIVSRIFEIFKLMVPVAGAFYVFDYWGEHTTFKCVALCVLPLAGIELILVIWDVIRRINEIDNSIILQANFF